MRNDLKVAVRSLSRAKGLTITVVLTLALGIGANAAIFTLVHGVRLRPLVNRDENRLIYIRQSAPGLGTENTNFSVPELKDIEAGVHAIDAFGDFSQIDFVMVGLGEPREVRAGVDPKMPSPPPVAASALVLLAAAVAASVLAARAARVDVIQALHSE